ncbi:MAG: M20 metallopeptidase family protein [Candidatus Kapaibacteriales bacterium]
MKKANIIGEIDKIYDELIHLRRKIHSYPELSFEEFHTSELIENYLNENGVATYRLLPTGVIAEIGNKRPKIIFRADIDALPIEEATGVEFSSKVPSVMHACGHDIHTTILLGTAKLLKRFESSLNVGIKLVFQPGEEKLPGGAKLLIERGLLNDNDLFAVFGLHTYPELEVGKIALSSGVIMSSADELFWDFKANGTHAGQPQLGNDAILTASHLTMALQNLRNKFVNPLRPALISITSINGGKAPNVFPDNVKMMGTLRTFNEDDRRVLLDKIDSFSRQISSLYGVKCKFEPKLGYPPLVNNAELVSQIKRIAEESLGEKCVVPFEPKMWAEDFAYFSQRLPSVFWFLGVKPRGYEGEFPGLHNPRYNPTEDAIKFGILLYLSLAFQIQIPTRMEQ